MLVLLNVEWKKCLTKNNRKNMKKSISRPDAATGTTTAKQERYEKVMTKKSFLKKADPTMVERLMDFENYKIKTLAQMLELVNDEEDIEQCKKVIQNLEKNILMGGRFNQYVLTYDEFNHIIEFEDENNDEICFGVNVQNINPDFYDYLDVACWINDMIEDYFGEAIIKDCGEFWEMKE